MRKQIAAAMLAGLAMLAGGSALADGMAEGIDQGRAGRGADLVGLLSGRRRRLRSPHRARTATMRLTTATFSSSYNGEGAAGGLGTVVLGFDRQIRDRYVVGLFTEFDWSSIELSYQDTDTPQQTFRLDRTFSLGGRAGFLMTPHVLALLTAGYSWSHAKGDGYFDIDADVDDLPRRDEAQPERRLRRPRHGNPAWPQPVAARRGSLHHVPGQDGQLVQRHDLRRPLTFSDRFEADLLTGRIALDLQVQPRRAARRTDQVALDRHSRLKGPALGSALLRCGLAATPGPLPAAVAAEFKAASVARKTARGAEGLGTARRRGALVREWCVLPCFNNGRTACRDL